MVILVQPLSASLATGSLNPETYIVDVGFGGVGLARPIPLVEGAQVKGTAPPRGAPARPRASPLVVSRAHTGVGWGR